jgi:hypothetical protein
MNGHDIVWSQPPALLDTPAARLLAAPRDAAQKPMILRFNHDGFMQEFMSVLESQPERLREFAVRRETWRGFTPAPVVEPAKAPSLVLRRLGILERRSSRTTTTAAPVATAAATVPAGTPLKLYQPAQQRHYLVACSLVCRVAGLPDRAIDTGRGEQTGCVIRRLLPPPTAPDSPVDTWDEHAWVARPQGFVWQPVGVEPLKMVDGEERLPLFAVQFTENERRRRRLFAGVVPVGRREAYLGAPKATGGSGAMAGVTARTSRKILLRKEVVEPWKTLVRRALGVQQTFTISTADGYERPSADQQQRKLRTEREQIQTISWFVLLDFAKYLAQYVKPVWRVVLDPSRRGELTPPEGDLYDALANARLSDELRNTIRRDAEISAIAGTALYELAAVPASLGDALAKFGSGADGINDVLEQQLDGVDRPYARADAASRAAWPPFLFPLADPSAPGDAPLPPVSAVATLDDEERGELALDANGGADDPLQRLDKLTVLVLRALRDDDPAPAPEPAVPAAAIAPVNALEGWFVIRCVYERPGCEPLHNEITSEPTEPFQMAGFFDPDAPARPIRIGLPIDTTPGGLRKFDKNTAFVISDTLCGQLGRLKGLTFGDLVLSVLPWPFHKDLPSLETEGGPCKTGDGLSLGMICSLSIPIVTICALILLIIMVALFDFLFKWIPYFVICFPLPGLKAKKKA